MFSRNGFDYCFYDAVILTDVTNSDLFIISKYVHMAAAARPIDLSGKLHCFEGPRIRGKTVPPYGG